jgi:glycosyltransferase involved in cell wall biosynthesis
VSDARAVDYVIDLRGIQSEAMPERGIPRYLANLTDALAERTDVDTLTGIVDPRRALPELSPAFGRHGGFGSADDEPVGLARAGERPLIHHVGSPFELGLRRQDLEPWWLRERRTVTAVSLFDVIPAVVPETFPPWARRLWRARAELVRAADVVLCISRHTADDGIRHLDLDPARVAVVGTGVPPVLAGSKAVPPTLPAVRRPFVLYTGGSDHPRKNIGALIRAFGLVPAPARTGAQLVIATRVSEAVTAELTAEAERAGIADSLVITGYVSDTELAALYRSCTVMAYPSLYEGFGLPIAEAMSHGAAVVASATTSCGEIQQHPAGRFDPTDDADIARALAAVLGSQALREELSAYGLARAADFTWEAVAQRTLDACRACAPAGDRRRRSPRSRERLFVIPGAPEPFTPQAGFLAIATAARDADRGVHVLADDERASAGGAPLLVSALECTPICLVHGPASAHIAAEALSRVPGIAVICELDSLLEPGSAAPHPYLLAALHHARRVVVASRVDAWRITAIAGRSLAAPPVVVELPLVLAGAAGAAAAEPPSIALLRPERLGAVGAPELARLADLLRAFPPRVDRPDFELCACLGAPPDDLGDAARSAGVGLAVRHPDEPSLARAARALVHLDVAGASHSASLFSAAAARAAQRPLVSVPRAVSPATARVVGAALESPGATAEHGADPRRVAGALAAIAAEIERPSRTALAASLTA